MASVSCPLVACNNVFKKCEFLRLNNAKCKVLLSYLNRAKDIYQSSACDSAKSEFCSAVERAQHLVDESSDHDEWLLKAVELWECSEYFVELFVDLCWSAQLMTLDPSKVRGFLTNMEILLNSRRPSAQSWSLETYNHSDKESLGDMVKPLLNPGALETGGEEYQLAHLLNDRFENHNSWHPPMLTSFEFELRIRIRSSGSSKRGQDGIVLTFKWVYKKQFAVKMCHPGTNHGRSFKHEFDVLNKYRNPYIVGVVGHWELEPPLQRRPWKHEVTLRPFLIMEAMDCNLDELIYRHRKSRRGQAGFSALETIKLMLPISKALRFLHAKDVAHRDVKLKNIMCSNIASGQIDDVIVKLIDFGEATDVSKFSFGCKHGRAGTNGFMDPEMFTPQGYGDLKRADVFSFAMVFVELLTWRWPWEETGVQRGREVQEKLNRRERPTLPENLPQYVCFIVESCWSADPHMRPTFDDICSMLQNAKLLISDRSFGEDDDDLFSYRDATFITRKYTVDRAVLQS